MDASGVFAEYENAIQALSDRLGEDKWFLGSRLVAFLYLPLCLTSSAASLQHWTLLCSHTYTPFSHLHIKFDSQSRAARTLWHGIIGFVIPFSHVS